MDNIYKKKYKVSVMSEKDKEIYIIFLQTFLEIDTTVDFMIAFLFFVL